MKAFAFRIVLLTAALSIATHSLQAAPSLSITKPPVTPNNLTGPLADPVATNGQWFYNPATGEEYRTHEFHDNTTELGGGNVGNYAIEGTVVPNSVLNPTGALITYGDPIASFKIEATIYNDAPSAYGDDTFSDNSHGESRQPLTEFYRGTLIGTRLVAEFSIGDTNALPAFFADPYLHPGYPSWIIADNEEYRAWYCWSPLDPPGESEAGNYYVPAWDFGDIPGEQSASKILSFTVDPPMPPSDPRYEHIHASSVDGIDLLANDTASLKISTWVDGLGDGTDYPASTLRGSNASVFHNIEEEPEVSHKMHYPQWPDPSGWDVRACNRSNLDPLQKVLADDFLCTSNGPITKITFWGSYQWNAPGSGEFGGITNFHLSIHRDIPAFPPEMPFSKPGGLLWVKNINPNSPLSGWTVTVTPEEPSDQGWYDPNHEQWDFDDHQQYYRYEITIPPDDAFVQEEGTIYWLDISVKLFQSEGGWGWKTSTEHWNDAAVWADLPVTSPAQWKPLFEPPEFEERIDLAFIIDGGEPDPTEEFDWGDAPDWQQPFTGPGDYQTVAADNGAVHMIVPQAPYFDDGTQTDQPDGEPDGQPEPNALGDDSDILYFPPINDDEDGIFFPAPLIVGMVGSVDITVDGGAGGGYVDAWIDYNQDGIWTAGEKIFSAWMPQGLNTIPVNVPAGAMPGLTFGRFRINSQAAGLQPFGIWPTGSMPDGEVEDHKVYIEEVPPEEFDWGDAPDGPYPTLAINNGARHLILSGGVNPTLGNLVDPEPDGQPSFAADGDDNDTFYPSLGDDEDGVTFNTTLIPGTVAQITVVANGAAGYIQCWIDANGNGFWGDPGEQVLTDIPLSIGNNSLTFVVPPNGTGGFVYAGIRFRYSSARGLTFTGPAQDGEVEDYREHLYPEVDVDWGDAPDPNYPTLQINNGAHHVIMPGMFLGGQVDPEPDGQPTPAADGDDTDFLYPSLGDDEDGVFFTSSVQAGGYGAVKVVASQPGVLDAWVDFENNGTWAEPGNRIFTAQALNAGGNILYFPVPVTASPGMAVARFRYTSGGIASYTGLAIDGEVEDHPVKIERMPIEHLDFGDAPFVPQVLLPAGAHHVIVPGVVLGALIDTEADGQPSLATDDDANGLDDEDGISFTSKIVAGSNATVDVVAGVSGGWLDAWIDYDANGIWVQGEHLWGGLSQPLTPGPNPGISFNVPAPPLALGRTFARFRISILGNLPPDGFAPDGEVEDYMVKLFQPAPTNLVITNLTFNSAITVSTNEWTVESGITYQLETKTNLLVNPWIPTGSTVIGPNNSQTDNMSSETNKFYRVTAPWTP